MKTRKRRRWRRKTRMKRAMKSKKNEKQVAAVPTRVLKAQQEDCKEKRQRN
jgi:hypothetical protein